MSRVMVRTASVSVPNSVLTTLLVCPAGHKYEVLEVFGSGGGQSPVDFIIAATFNGVGYFLDLQLPASGAFYAYDRKWTGLVLYPGENFAVEAIYSGAAHTDWAVTYVDVDPG